MKEFHYVYLTTNLINGHQYVGDRSYKINPKEDNYIGSGILFNKKKKEYGEKNFKKIILEQFETRLEAFNAQEKYIKQFNTLVPNGYNISPSGGFGFKGGHHSKESILKISINSKGKNKGKKHSEEQNKNFSECMKGRKQSEESNKKRSESLKRKPKSEEHKNNLKGKNKGKKHSEEQNLDHNLKVSKTLKGHLVSAETRKKLKESNIGKHNVTEETRKKQSDAKKGKKQSPEFILKRTKNLKGLKRSEETKQKMKKPKSEEHRKNISKNHWKRKNNT
jgi:hypothetical protein